MILPFEYGSCYYSAGPWADIHDAASAGTRVGFTSFSTYSLALVLRDGSNSRNIYRTILEIDLSSVPEGKTVTAAQIILTGTGDGNGNYVIQKAPEASGNLLTNYSKGEGAPSDSIAYVEGENIFTLGATLRTYLSSGLGAGAVFILREADHDYDDVEPPEIGTFQGTFYTQRWSNGDLRPQLKLTYKD